MPPPDAGTHSLHLTLVTVCVDPELAGRALDAADRAGWTLEEAHFETAISARRRPHLGSHLHGNDGALALIDFDRDTAAAVEASAYLQQVFGERLVIMALAAAQSPELMLEAMHAHCAEFLIKPEAGPAAATALQPPDPTLRPESPFDHELDRAFLRVAEHFSAGCTTTRAAGSILAFFGAKGGVGATTLALHLATFLVENNRKKVLLIDNHLHFGHACIYLGIDGSEVHFQELVRNVSRLDSELLRGFIATHCSGLDVLSSPDVGKAARPMHPDDVANTLEFLRGEYDFILVDCAAILDDVNRAVVAASSHVYVVATPEISAIRDLSRYCDDLGALADTREKVRVILNRYSSQFAVSLDTVEKAIRLPITFCIPNNFVELVRSANLGVPVPSNSKSGFALDLQRWANSLVGVKDEFTRSEDARLTPRRWGSLPALRATLGDTLSALLPHPAARKQA